MGSKNYDVIIIGAGAAGLFCAALAGQKGHSVLVLDHANKVGKKILMSGGGRCNFTNTDTSPANYLSTNPHFCKSALARFRPRDFIDLVEKHHIAYHEKELGQLFCNDSSKQILNMLLSECAQARVEIQTDCSINSVQQLDDQSFSLNTSHGTVNSQKLIIASGGLSIPSMGASGFGYHIAQQFGHSIITTRASLVPLTLSGKPLEEWADLSGVAFPVSVRHGKVQFDNQLLITHRGLSGPAILQISNYWQAGDALHINLLPQLNVPEWLASQVQERGACEIKTVLAEVLPKRFAQRFAELHAPQKLMRQLNHAEHKALAHKLENWPITANGTEGYRTAEVTLGGVNTQEISSASMESKKTKGLYFIGEVLDVTGWLGGYNFQWAWASAHACASAL